MAGTSEVTILAVVDNIVFVLPGIVGGLFIYLSVRTLRHMAVLPACTILLLLLFYVTLWATQTTIKEATDLKWVRKMEPPPAWYRTWDYLKFNKVVWSALPQITITELSMIFVVALSSSLDIAAIELELGRPLNYNGELSMVGISNVVSGLTGGYTGSYIFSQSLFNLRAGIRSRLSGYVLAACQLIVVLIPFPLLSYVPNFFFGSLLSMIAVDLCYEWLWDVRTKLTTVEYVICLATFGMIQVVGIEYGILLGVVLYVVCQKLGLDLGELKIATMENEDDERSEKEGLSMRSEPSCFSVDYGSV